MSEQRKDRSWGRIVLVAAVLLLLSFAGNWVDLPTAYYSVSIILGSIFTLVAVGLFGGWWGAAALREALQEQPGPVDPLHLSRTAVLRCQRCLHQGVRLCPGGDRRKD